MPNKVAISSFVAKDSGTGLDRVFRQDTTVVAATDAVYLAVPQLFIDSGGAKLATASFVYKDAAGVDRFVRKGKTHVAVSHAAYLAAPALFA